MRDRQAGVAARILAIDDLRRRAIEDQRAAALVHMDIAVAHGQHVAAIELRIAARGHGVDQAGKDIDIAGGGPHVAGDDGRRDLGIGRRVAIAVDAGDLHPGARIGQLLIVETQQIAVEGGIAAHDVDRHGQPDRRALGGDGAGHRDGIERRGIRGVDPHGVAAEIGRLAGLDRAAGDTRLGRAAHHVDIDRAGQRELLGQRAGRAHRHHERRRMRGDVQLALHVDGAVLDQGAGARTELIDADRRAHGHRAAQRHRHAARHRHQRVVLGGAHRQRVGRDTAAVDHRRIAAVVARQYIGRHRRMHAVDLHRSGAGELRVAQAHAHADRAAAQRGIVLGADADRAAARRIHG